MTLHTPTIVVLSIIIDLLLVLILLHAWRTRTTYPGFTHWVAGTACWTIGSLLTMLLANLQPIFIPRVIGVGLILLHPILLYEGLTRFYGFRRTFWGLPLNLGLACLQLLISFYCSHVVDDYALRSALINLLLAFLFGRIAVQPLLNREIRSIAMQWLMSASMLPLSALLLVRGYRLFSESGGIPHIAVALADDPLLRWLVLYGIVVELVIAYSYLSLTSDRMERELQKARQAAEQASRVKGTFLKMVSHELRTPLATVAGISELLMQRGGTSDERVRMLQRAVRHQERLIGDLLDSAAIEAGRISIIPRPFSLKSLLDEFRDTYLPRCRERGVNYQGIRSPDLPEMIVGDRQRIFQVCANLIENALKFTPPGGGIIARAELQSDREPPMLCFSATDTGPGIPLEQQEAIFAPFVSLDTATPGLGLGLAICRQLAGAMGGEITCESRPGEGSTFRFTIPCTLPAPDWQPSVATGDMGSTLQHPLRILAVDDTPENLQLLQFMLEGQPVTATLAGSGKEALQQLEQQTFDLVLTDISMAGMSGLELVSAIRRSEAQRQCPPLRITAVSANASPEDIQSALAAGCDSYLPRPFTLQELLHELSQAPAAAAPRQGAQGPPDPFQQLREQAQKRIIASLALAEEALSNGDAAVIRDEGHRIKGLGMTFGLEDAERIGSLLEQAGRDGCLDNVSELLDKLKGQP